MTNNPIELLIALAVNNAKTKSNIDESIRELERNYDKNPLLLNVDIDKTKALANLQKFVSEASKQNIELNIDLASGDLTKARSQAQELKSEFEALGDVLKKTQSGSSKSFDLDLDRVLIQLDNLGRKGVVASSELAKFQGRIESLRQTNDRLSLKEIVTDIFDITSSSGHADKVLDQLNQSLIKVGQSQQRLSDIKDKFNIDPKANDEYARLSQNIESAIQDVIRLQSVASTGGADEIKLAKDMRDIQERIAEAKRELVEFNRTAKSESDLSKLTKQADELYEKLKKTGSIDVSELDNFSKNIKDIANGSDTTISKLNQLETAITNLKAAEKGASAQESLEAQFDRQFRAAEKLESKILRIGTIHKSTVDKMEYRRLAKEAAELTKSLDGITDPRAFKEIQGEYRKLSAEVDRLGANAVTAARASQGLGGALKQAFQKFPVWMLSATTFYAPIRGFTDLTEKVIELDSAMIQLQRVMDAPSYRYNEMMQEMIVSSDELSGKMSDYMQLYTEFARTGLDGQSLTDMTETATILQNISELTPEETVNSLTAAMTAFGEETGGALRIADRLNEINFISLLVW